MQLYPISLFQPRPPQAHLPLFVFFPGMDGTGQLLYRQIDRLTARFDIRCVAIASNDLSDWDGLVDRALQLIATELTEGRELYFCGESFGACFAMQAASQIASKISELVLINPASSLVRLPWLASGSALTRILPDVLYPLSARILVNFLIDAERVAPPDRQRLLNAMLSVQPQSAAWRLDLLRQFDVQTILPKIVDIPVSLIAGALDRLLPSVPEVQILEQLLPRSKTKFLPYSGHACLLEKDIYLADLL
jgi:pimeloyl-ACP methyl ester carboxylesterase